MKHLFFAALFLLSFQSNFAQIRTKSVMKPVVKPEKIVQYASEIDVYIAIQDGIYTTNEIYELFRGENPKIKLMAYSYGAPSINPQVTAMNGVFPSLVNNYQTIAYKLQIAKPEKPSYIVACIDEQELASKDAQAAIGAKDNNYIPKDMTKDVLAHTKTIGGGETTSVEFKAPAKGTYDFICSFPGHVALMHGQFIVE